MKPEEYSDKLMDKLAGELTENEICSFEAEISANQSLKDDLAFFSDKWEALGKIEAGQPSEEMSSNFYALLNKQVKKEEGSFRSKWNKWVGKALQPVFLARLSFGLLLLAVGFILGGKFNNPKVINVTTAEQPAEASKSISSIPASVRLEQLYASSRGDDINNKAVADVLMGVLENDPNVNVRLAAANELAVLANSSKVRQQMVKHLRNEESPQVQVSLLNVLKEHAKPKESISTMEKMLDVKQLNPYVKEKIERDLTTLKAGYKTTR